jgi:hypothetical protein
VQAKAAETFAASALAPVRRLSFISCAPAAVVSPAHRAR